MFWSYVEIHCVKPVEEEIAVFKKRCVLCLFHSVWQWHWLMLGRVLPHSELQLIATATAQPGLTVLCSAHAGALCASQYAAGSTPLSTASTQPTNQTAYFT